MTLRRTAAANKLVLSEVFDGCACEQDYNGHARHCTRMPTSSLRAVVSAANISKSAFFSKTFQKQSSVYSKNYHSFKYSGNPSSSLFFISSIISCVLNKVPLSECSDVTDSC